MIRNNTTTKGVSSTENLQQSISTVVQKAKKRTRKNLHVGVYVAVFLILMSSVAAIYQSPWRASASAPIVGAVADGSAGGAVDKLLAVNIAGSFAETTSLAVSSNISETSVTMVIDKELAQQSRSTASVEDKPQLVGTPVKNRAITTYRTQTGDTVQSVAAKYGISIDTLKWANDLTGDLLAINKDLSISPVDGVVYTAKEGDTAESIAKHLSADATRITAFNSLEVSGIKSGDRIVVPGGVLPENERPGYVPPRPIYAARSITSANTPVKAGIVNSRASVMAGNAYAFGNCTYYVYNQRAAIGRPIGSFWGNASSWASSAIGAGGYVVNKTPAVGAIAQWNPYAGGSGYAGHVGIVESVNSDGTVTLTEMNNGAYGGYNIVNSRTIPASAVSNYIH